MPYKLSTEIFKAGFSNPYSVNFAHFSIFLTPNTHDPFKQGQVSQNHLSFNTISLVDFSVSLYNWRTIFVQRCLWEAQPSSLKSPCWLELGVLKQEKLLNMQGRVVPTPGLKERVSENPFLSELFEYEEPSQGLKNFHMIRRFWEESLNWYWTFALRDSRKAPHIHNSLLKQPNVAPRRMWQEHKHFKACFDQKRVHS